MKIITYIYAEFNLSHSNVETQYLEAERLFEKKAWNAFFSSATLERQKHKYTFILENNFGLQSTWTFFIASQN